MTKIILDTVVCGDGLDVMRGMPAKSVDLVMGSPPYANKGERYGTGKKWKTLDWVDWMYRFTVEAIRIARNIVVWVVNGSIVKGHYEAAV